jgi:transcriptional regulator with XRE-family HTH domain
LKNDTGNIAGRLRAARQRAQMEPAELRAALREHGIDLSKTGLHRLETTEPRNPNLKMIEAIAEITSVSPSWILFGTGPSVPGTEVGAAIRSRVIDTIELMSGALNLTARQESTLRNWLKSVRETRPTGPGKSQDF